LDAYILSGQEIFAMHIAVMTETNDIENAGIDPKNGQKKFEYMLERPTLIVYGEEQFPSILAKSCCYLHSIVRGHIFNNGNKRTGSYVFLTYLDIHDLKLVMPKDIFEDYVVHIAEDDKYKSNDCIRHIFEELENHVIPKDDPFGNPFE
jgi:death-on-curing protein